MKLKGFACLLIDNIRSKAYIQKLAAHSLLPEKVIFLDRGSASGTRASPPEPDVDPVARVIQSAFRNRRYFLYSNGPQSLFPVGDRRPAKYRSFEPQQSVLETVGRSEIDLCVLRAGSLNDPTVIAAVADAPQKYFLFAGGGILRREILGLGKKFIHIHPGLLPDVKGSMAVEWSLLVSDRCAASAIFMAEQIDAGEILLTRFFEPPELEFGNVSPYYSPHIRSEVLLDLVREYARTGEFAATPQDPEAGETYYRMHPALGNVVFSKLQSGGTE
jgi:hypothetical protein